LEFSQSWTQLYLDIHYYFVIIFMGDNTSAFLGAQDGDFVSLKKAGRVAPSGFFVCIR
jgi:hypothetical protein